MATVLIWLLRNRIPEMFRLYTAFSICDLSGRLPETTFLPHPYGLVISGVSEIGCDVVIGHQATISDRNGVMDANATITKDVPAGATAVEANRIL